MEMFRPSLVEPKDSKAYSVSKVLRGYLSIYKKYVGLDDRIKRLTQETNFFLNDLVEKYQIDHIEMCYVPDCRNLVIIEHICSFSGIMASRILSDITAFADEYGMTLAIKESERPGNISHISDQFNEGFGFFRSNGEVCEEIMLRHPRFILNESASYEEATLSAIEVLTKKESIQDIEYKKKWYKEYVKLINSEEYKERRKKEFVKVTIVKKRLNRDEEDDARIGFAFVGSAVVV